MKMKTRLKKIKLKGSTKFSSLEILKFKNIYQYGIRKAPPVGLKEYSENSSKFSLS
jgi:hypothetical protein